MTVNASEILRNQAEILNNLEGELLSLSVNAENVADVIIQLREALEETLEYDLSSDLKIKALEAINRSYKVVT